MGSMRSPIQTGVNGTESYFDGERVVVELISNPQKCVVLVPAEGGKWAVFGPDGVTRLGDTETLQSDAVAASGLRAHLAKLMQAAAAAVKMVDPRGRPGAIDILELLPADGEPPVSVSEIARLGLDGWTPCCAVPADGGGYLRVLLSRPLSTAARS